MKVMPKALDTGPGMCKQNVIGKEQKFCLEEFVICARQGKQKGSQMFP